MSDQPDIDTALWLVYRSAIRKHLATDTGPASETEDEYRVRAEKAGLVAVANFVGKAYQAGAAA